MNYYQFHVGDYISHTAHLDPIEDLAFRRLLDLYYQSESPIPNETKMVSKRIRLGSHEQEVINVLSEFFELIDGYWHHSRCDKEILAYQVKSERNREVGKLGGRPKKNPEETTMVISGNPNETLTKNQEPITNISITSSAEPTGCKLSEVVDVYHDLLNGLPKVRMLDKKRQTALNSRQREYPKSKELDWWHSFFSAASESKFLMGESSGDRSWRADFDFLISPKGFKGVIEGKYQ
jgi:uncharacterized protein YdaU (DUF1376 family)